MSSYLTLAVDAMGDAHTPQAVAEGCHMVWKRFVSTPNYTHIKFQVYGNREGLKAFDSYERDFMNAITLVECETFIRPDEKAVSILRRLNEASSLKESLDATARGECHATVSAGNTGAYMILASKILGCIPFVERPAIASLIPTQKGQSVMLDLGGNLESSAEHLYHMAVMGCLFAKHVLGCVNPSVGLLNVGTEMTKGPEQLRQAYELCTRQSLFNFYGFVEGYDIAKGTTDVIVSEGFTGNIALKTGEGMFRLMQHSLQKVLASSWRGKLGYLIARPCFKALQEHFNPQNYNGAIWLGFNKAAVKSHGSANSQGMACALFLASQMVQSNLIAQINNELQAIAPAIVPSDVSQEDVS